MCVSDAYQAETSRDCPVVSTSSSVFAAELLWHPWWVSPRSADQTIPRPCGTATHSPLFQWCNISNGWLLICKSVLTYDVCTENGQRINIQINVFSEQTYSCNQHPDQEKGHCCLILNFTSIGSLLSHVGVFLSSLYLWSMHAVTCRYIFAHLYACVVIRFMNIPYSLNALLLMGTWIVAGSEVLRVLLLWAALCMSSVHMYSRFFCISESNHWVTGWRDAHF